MVKVNAVWIFSPDGNKVLMCKRHKDPYLGLYNIVGGKIDNGEEGLVAAYRELQEETGIHRVHLQKSLHHLMDFVYYNPQGCYLEIYVGRLTEMIMVCGDERELVWMDVREDFFDMGKFAGEGNLGHIYEQIKLRPGII